MKKIFLNVIGSKEKILYWVIIFFLGCFIGWIYEELFYLFIEHTLYNRGFLYGPYLPVYGWGSVAIILFLKKYKKNPIFVFIAIMFLTGILEYITGYIMWEIWNNRWWDYTGLFLNIDGYVCLRSVITFAIGGVMLIYIIEPAIIKLLSSANRKKVLSIICVIISIVFIIDNLLAFLIRHPF